MTNKALLLLLIPALIIYADQRPIYNNEYAMKTKEVVMISQLRTKDLSIDVDGLFYGKRGFFSSFSDDPNWHGSVSLNTIINNCISDANINDIEKAGFILKSYNADGLVVSYREAVKQQKANGAKYIFIQTSQIDRDPLKTWKKAMDDWERIKPKEFTEFCKIWQPRNPNFTPLEMKDLYEWHMDSWNKLKPIKPVILSDYKIDTSLNDIKTEETFENYFQTLLNDKVLQKNNKMLLPEGCFRDNSFKFTDLLFIAGQVAVLAVGVKGAGVGNTQLTSLAGNTNNALSNQAKLTSTNNQIANNVDSDKIAGIQLKTSVKIYGSMDPSYFTKNGLNNDVNKYKLSGLLFPIEEVESYLAHYKDISYNVHITQYK